MAVGGLHAQAVTAEEVEAWLRAEWRRAGDWPDLRNIAVTWAVQYPIIFTQADIDRLRAKVKGKPDHPDRCLLARYERELKRGPDTSVYTFWRDNSDRWRLNNTKDYAEYSPYWDCARTKREVWALMPQGLVIIDPDDPPANRDYAAFETDAWVELGYMLLSGMHGGRSHEDPSRNRTLREVGVDGDRWWAIARNDGSPVVVIRFTGRWDHDAGRGFVEESRIIEADDVYASSVGQWTECDQWRFDEVLQMWVATTVRRFRPDGTVRQLCMFVSAEPYTDGEFEQLVALPGYDGSDPLRGEYTFGSVQDYRPGVATVRYQTPGEIVEAPLPSSAPSGAGVRLRHVGWAILAILVATFIGIRIYRGRGV